MQLSVIKSAASVKTVRVDVFAACHNKEKQN